MKLSSWTIFSKWSVQSYRTKIRKLSTVGQRPMSVHSKNFPTAIERKWKSSRNLTFKTLKAFELAGPSKYLNFRKPSDHSSIAWTSISFKPSTLCLHILTIRTKSFVFERVFQMEIKIWFLNSVPWSDQSELQSNSPEFRLETILKF